MISAWNPSIRSATAIRGGKKRCFVDPSIAVAALGASPRSLEKDLHTFGFIFECLCIRDLKVYSHGLEADVVLIKHLVQERNAKERRVQMREPDLMIVLTGGEFVYRRKDGVYVIPVGCLKN